MGLRLVGAGALAAVCLAGAIGPKTQVTAEEVVKSPDVPAAQRWAQDPTAADMAAEKRLSFAEAQRRIGVQKRAPELDGALTAVLGPARYGGIWIGTDDRIKVGIVQPTTRSTVTRTAAARRLAAEIDLVPVRHSLASILAANGWLARQLVRANKDAKQAMVTGYTTAGNTVRLGVPSQAAGLSSAQRAVLRQARERYGSMLTIYTRAGKSKREADCGPLGDELPCDLPLRGGVGIGPYGCSLGYLARGRRDNRLYAFTAGHCVKDQSAQTVFFTHTKGGTRIGLGTRKNFSYGNTGDAGLINITDPIVLEKAAACRCSWVVVLASSSNDPGIPGTTTNERYPIRHDDTSLVGMRVCHSGKTSGTSCGRVLELGVTTDEGVGNLALTNYCSAPGDSGGPVYSGNTAFGIHQGRYMGSCSGVYQGIRGAENLMDADVVFDGAGLGTAYRHNKDQLSPRKFSFARRDGRRCHYRVMYGDFGNVAYAKVRFYAGPCGGSGVEVLVDLSSGPWTKDREGTGEDSCGPFFEFQATSPPGNRAVGMTVVTPDGDRITYSHQYTSLPYNTDGPLCP